MKKQLLFFLCFIVLHASYSQGKIDEAEDSLKKQKPPKALKKRLTLIARITLEMAF